MIRTKAYLVFTVSAHKFKGDRIMERKNTMKIRNEASTDENKRAGFFFKEACEKGEREK